MPSAGVQLAGCCFNEKRVATARDSNQLFFAALIPAERISAMFGEAGAILDSARVYEYIRLLLQCGPFFLRC